MVLLNNLFSLEAVDLGCKASSRGTAPLASLAAQPCSTASPRPPRSLTHAAGAGIDASAYFVATAQDVVARRRAAGAAGSVTVRHGLAEATGLPHASVDVVSMCLVMHELPVQASKDIMAEAFRCALGLVVSHRSSRMWAGSGRSSSLVRPQWALLCHLFLRGDQCFSMPRALSFSLSLVRWKYRRCSKSLSLLEIVSRCSKHLSLLEIVA